MKLPSDTDNNIKRPNRLSRRDLLRISALSSLTCLAGPSAMRAAVQKKANGTAQLARYAVFHSLAPGAVEPNGWLRLYLTKQADQLASHLPQVSWPFSDEYWAGEEKRPGVDAWWPWEQRAYWVDGALRCALASGDERLLKLASRAVDYTLTHVDSDGYLGPTFAKLPTDQSNFRWPHAVFFRALAAYGDATGDSRVPSVMTRHYLSDKGHISYGGPSRNVTNVESMLWAYSHTGDERLLSMAIDGWNGFLHSAPPGDHESGDLHPERVFSNAPIDAHGVTYAEKSKLPAILFMHTGNREYLRYAVAAQERIFSRYMLVDGIPSASEAYRGITALDAHETCDITDHMWSWGYLLMATGDGVWGDRIERACFNAGFGAIKKDWKALQYFSCPNQVIATGDSNHVPYIEQSKGWMAYRPNPGEKVACCGGNVHRFFPNYVIRMWMADAKGGLAATLYGASTVHATVGANRVPIEIHQETDYPFGEEIHFTLTPAKPVAFGLSLRIPAWCKDPKLVLNGNPVSLPLLNKGFVRLERVFHPGDRLTLMLPMQIQTSQWPGNGIGVEHGPLVYSLRIKEQWTSVVTPKWSSAEFPQWNALPASTWNYALALDKSQSGLGMVLERKPMTSDPWVEPPVKITALAKEVFGWRLRPDGEHPERLKTPPLPVIYELERSSPIEGAERVTLVPYGTTQLRLTIFPRL